MSPTEPFPRPGPVPPPVPVYPAPVYPVPIDPGTDADLRLVAPALGGGRELLRAPVSAATWRAVSQATIGFPVLLAAGIVAMVMIPLSVGLAVLGVGIPMLLVTLLAARWAAPVERARLAVQLGVEIPPAQYPRTPGRGWWASCWAVLTDARSWAHLGYALVGLWLNLAQVIVAWGVGGWSVAALAAPAWLLRDGSDGRAAGLVVLGVLGVWVWALASQGLALVHVRLARSTLGQTGSAAAVAAARAQAQAAQAQAAQAQERAQHLDETRTRAVGAADDDRRRIERDLHDGAQQRLVALGVELGSAKRAAATDPDAAAAALDHAHREVKETLAELRDLVRGIHPAVLTDRGLDAALSAIAARNPVPVRVDVPDPQSLALASPAAQAAAYFVAAEALTNTARHSGAAQVHVRAEVVAGLLRLQIIDDGHGGAVARPGGGLDGLRSRVEALDGTFRLDSPVGRGTRLTMEVPCAS